MKNLARFIAAAACLAGSAALVPQTALAAGGRGFSGGHSVGSAGWHGGGSHYGGGHYGGGWRGGYGGHRGYYGRPGVIWGGVGLGLGLGAVGYYGGAWAPYGYAPSYYVDGPVYDSYSYGAVAPVVVAPGEFVPIDPAARAGQAVPPIARAPDPIFYPNKGQSAATTENERRDCNRWATTQSGAMADASIFQRATLACMEGRGYTVK